MADDRLFLKCNICGDMLFLGKQFGFGPFYNEFPLEERLNAFFKSHCHEDADTDRFNGDYSIAYETDSEKERRCVM